MTHPVLTDTEVEAAKMGKAVVTPAIQATLTTAAFTDKGVTQPDLAVLRRQLHAQCEAINAGDLRHVESMLAAQAATLDVIFGSLARRAAGCLGAGGSLATVETFMRMAFRAQAQCRTTLEALVDAKNPPIVFARQANVTTGPQQVNNGLPPSRAGKSETEQTQLLECQHGERMDTGTESAAISSNPAMATLDKIDRAEDPGR